MTEERILDMARRLTQVHGVSGREYPAAAAAAELLAPMGQVEISPLGSVCCTVCPGAPNAPHIVLEAHLDQIGLIVTHLEENGFLRVANVGGFDRRLLPAAPVTIHTENGDFPGVIASVPPHLASDEDREKPPKIEDLLIDTGCSTETARQRFAPGDLITLDGHFILMNEKYLVSNALDDRIGCVSVIAAAEELHRLQPGWKVTVLLASMEEIGGGGAPTSAFHLTPDQAIAVDVTFGNGFGIPEHRCRKMGGGPCVGIAPAVNREMASRLMAVAEAAGIPWQPEVMGGRTGTDTDAIASSGRGVRTALLSIPQRNMHTIVETIHLDDVINTARLMAEYVKEGAKA